jgi:hypothetical protein
MGIGARLRPILRRYAAAELAGTGTACAGAWLSYRANGTPYAAGLGGSLCETAGYYAAILWDEARRRRQPGVSTARTVLRALPGVIVEFGPAELVDTLVVRPLLMAAGPSVAGGQMAGTLAGKVAADVVFYALAVPGSRLRRRLFAVPAAPRVPRAPLAITATAADGDAGS